MTFILSAVLKYTVGLLVRKGRDYLTEKLKDGDVTDQQFRDWVVHELYDIRSKIDGLARKDLLASISFFKEGLELLYQLLDQLEYDEVNTIAAREGMEDAKLAVSLPSVSGGSKISVNKKSFIKKLNMLKLDELSETAKRMLEDAKKRFEEARVEATRAFSNDALKTSDRILAMKYRIVATLMGKFDSPSSALASCKVCLEELHNIPAIQNYFNVEITKSWKSRFKRNERRDVIADVCHMNFVVYSVTKTMGDDWLDVFKSPCVDIGILKINPLRDVRLIKALSEFKLDHCCLREWTFGREGELNDRLDGPVGITTNTQGQLIVADSRNVKVFDSSGKFLRSIFSFSDEQKKMSFFPWRVANDGNGYLYVLASLKKRSKVEWCGVFVIDQHENLHHKFPLRQQVNITWNSSLTVSDDGKVFVLTRCDGQVPQVDMYDTDGKFVYSLGQGVLASWKSDITNANDDRVIVLDGESHRIHVFSTQGDLIHQFDVQGDTEYGAIAFHQPREQIMVSSWSPEKEYRGQVSIYTKCGEFVRSIQLDTNKKPSLLGLTVTIDGHIFVTNYWEDKVHFIPY